jgi:hypothetical protein
MGSGAVRVYPQLRIPVNGSESCKKRDELIYFIVRVSMRGKLKLSRCENGSVIDIKVCQSR